MAGTKIPVRMESLKIFYEKYEVDWTASRYIKPIMLKNNHVYTLRDNGELEISYWYDELVNRDKSIPKAIGQMKNGQYWRITVHGLAELAKYYGIKDENYKLVTKAMLTQKIKFK